MLSYPGSLRAVLLFCCTRMCVCTYEYRLICRQKDRRTDETTGRHTMAINRLVTDHFNGQNLYRVFVPRILFEDLSEIFCCSLYYVLYEDLSAPSLRRFLISHFHPFVALRHILPVRSVMLNSSRLKRNEF